MYTHKCPMCNRIAYLPDKTKVYPCPNNCEGSLWPVTQEEEEPTTKSTELDPAMSGVSSLANAQTNPLAEMLTSAKVSSTQSASVASYAGR